MLRNSHAMQIRSKWRVDGHQRGPWSKFYQGSFGKSPSRANGQVLRGPLFIVLREMTRMPANLTPDLKNPNRKPLTKISRTSEVNFIRDIMNDFETNGQGISDFPASSNALLAMVAVCMFLGHAFLDGVKNSPPMLAEPQTLNLKPKS